jgi:biotin synthase-like enzyme
VRTERKRENFFLLKLIHKFTFYLNVQNINNSIFRDQEFVKMTGRLKFESKSKFVKESCEYCSLVHQVKSNINDAIQLTWTIYRSMPT